MAGYCTCRVSREIRAGAKMWTLDRIRLLGTLHLPRLLDAFRDGCGLFTKAICPAWYFCRIRCALISVQSYFVFFHTLTSIILNTIFFQLFVFLQDVQRDSTGDCENWSGCRKGGGGSLRWRRRCQTRPTVGVWNSNGCSVQGRFADFYRCRVLLCHVFQRTHRGVVQSSKSPAWHGYERMETRL